jgi:hypothetical protein
VYDSKEKSRIFHSNLPCYAALVGMETTAAFQHGRGYATTAGFFSCGGLPLHGAIAEAFRLAIGQETQQALAANVRTAN